MRYRDQEPHSGAGGRTATNDHTQCGVEVLSGPRRGRVPQTRQKTVLRSVQHVVVKTTRPWSIYREPTITQWRSRGVRGLVNYHKMAQEEERSFQQCNTIGVQENLGEILQ